MTAEVPSRVFDRRVQFDERSRQFPIRALLPAAPKPRSFTWSCAIQLDQGADGACIGFGWSHEGAARPVCVPGITNESAFKLYHRAQELDGFPETPPEEGSSVIAGAKAAQELGWMTAYHWAFGLNDLVLAVGLHGPAVLGLNWRAGMMDTDASGFIHATGDVVGGHCICCVGVNVKKKTFTLKQSWGAAWGLGGVCYVSWDDMDARLHDQGEACIPTGRRMPKP